MTDCNKIRYRPVTGEVQPQQVYKCMTVVYSDYMLSYLMVTCWAVEFPRGRRRLQDEPRPGQSELFYFTGIFKKKTPKFAINCTLTKVMVISKKICVCSSICLLFN